MSNNLETFVLNRFDKNQIETGYLNSLLANNPVLELSPDQINNFEEAVQANLNYKPGRLGCITIPFSTAKNIINPLQVIFSSNRNRTYTKKSGDSKNRSSSHILESS